jgi:hypothetical protein
MSKELCDSPLKIKKSSRSGVLLISRFARGFSCMFWYSSGPSGLIRQEPEYWCFAMKSPPTRNLCPSALMKVLYYSILILWRRGQ